MTDIPTLQTNIQLYKCADELVQNTIIKTHTNLFPTDPKKLLKIIKALVTRQSNPIVHRIAFASTSQGANERIQQYLVPLMGTALDCNFLCTKYYINIKNRGYKI